ncbi:MAG: ABC transporter ATP-binding protein [Solobacterium sp.]|nr:ABC transporter ATP-binding protein [Solobacterium sp.]
MIRFEHVSFSYENDKQVLHDLSFDIKGGESVGLIGANGAGKSTVMKVMLGLLKAEGKVTMAGLEMNDANLAQIRRKTGFVLQNSDNQMFMPTVYEDLIFAPMNYGMSEEEADRKASAILEQLGISELKDRYNHRLSGGEKRMAAIAVILAMDPEVILMDEPTSALDPYNRRIVLNTIRSMKGTRLVASHDLDLILDVCDRVMLIDRGTVIADGKAEEILRKRELLEAHRLELPLRYQ